ncbi:hypothetical protein PR048_008627 [Dryococelus australis]|uniref:Uncharacterized protein n=1 Tax=Dryococelus australis TaxID=614101 RepID=A0ABQ9HZD9_9NEOP|nr:hypothetical protein PR048_008627 [Dryococelus australis]
MDERGVGWTPRLRSRSERTIRVTLTRTPSASSLLRARRAIGDADQEDTYYFGRHIRALCHLYARRGDCIAMLGTASRHRAGRRTFVAIWRGEVRYGGERAIWRGEIWAAIDIVVLRVLGSEVSAGMQGEREIPEKTFRRAASSGTINSSENLGATPQRNNPGYPKRETRSTLATTLQQPRLHGGYWLLLRAPRMYSSEQAPAYLATVRHTPLLKIRSRRNAWWQCRLSILLALWSSHLPRFSASNTLTYATSAYAAPGDIQYFVLFIPNVTEPSTLESCTLVGGRVRIMILYYDRPMRYPLHHDDSLTASLKISLLNYCFFRPSPHPAVETMLKRCKRLHGVTGAAEVHSATTSRRLLIRVGACFSPSRGTVALPHATPARRFSQSRLASPRRDVVSSLTLDRQRLVGLCSHPRVQRRVTWRAVTPSGGWLTQYQPAIGCSRPVLSLQFLVQAELRAGTSMRTKLANHERTVVVHWADSETQVFVQLCSDMYLEVAAAAYMYINLALRKKGKGWWQTRFFELTEQYGGSTLMADFKFQGFVFRPLHDTQGTQTKHSILSKIRNKTGRMELQA